MGGVFEQTVESQVIVPFAGPGAGTAPLTWGQKAILQDMRETGWTHNSSGAHALPPGTTVDDVAEQLRALMSRNPSLRVRLGTDEHGDPCQVLAESGEIPLTVVDIADDLDPDDAAKYTNDLWYSWLLTPFDLYRDWSTRMAVVRHRGAALYRVTTFNHVVADGVSIVLLMADLGLGEGGDPDRDDARTVPILDLARREQTRQLRQVSERAMRHWESHLRGIPTLTFGEPTHPEGRLGKRYWHGRFSSPATYLAVLAIAQRTRTDTSRVLLAVITTAVARATGVNPLTAKVIVSNRFRPGLARTIAPLSQNAVLTLDVSDATVDEAVARARLLSLTAGMNAYYDPDQLAELTARMDRERGYPGRVSCRINDRRLMRRPSKEVVADQPATLERIGEKLSETFLVWDGTIDNLPEQAFITIEDQHETILLQVIFDMACFTESQVEALLRGVEEVAVAAAFDPTARTGV